MSTEPTENEKLHAAVRAGIQQLEHGQYRTYRPEECDRFLRDIEAASQEIREAVD